MTGQVDIFINLHRGKELIDLDVDYGTGCTGVKGCFTRKKSVTA